jgi:ATP-dependent DNA helicase RecG
LVDTQPELFRIEGATQEMNGIQIIPISDAEVRKILTIEEGHFVDVKAIETSPGRLTKAIAALSNAEGGELFIGIDEGGVKKGRRWRGFSNQEAANAHIQVFEQLFPLGTDYKYDFLGNDHQTGLVLKIQVAKTRDIRGHGSAGVVLRQANENANVNSEQ